MANIWIVGASAMAAEYAKVLQGLNQDFVVIGRGEKSAKSFAETTGINPFVGGLDQYLLKNPSIPTHVIAAVGVEQLCATAQSLLAYGVKNILLEKPGGVDIKEMDNTAKMADKVDANVFIAYNRRFYSSVLKAEEIIKEDGGVTSFNFEFTEWSHAIHPDHRPVELFNNWLLANSTHVIDTAFFLGGEPIEMSCYKSGENCIEWHPSGSIYSGAGVTKSGALFSYQANWQAPGRWAIEILTRKHRLYFKPMESLQIQNIGSVKVDPVEIDDVLDRDYKAGFYLQTQAFLEGDNDRFCTLSKQLEHINGVYAKIR